MADRDGAVLSNTFLNISCPSRHLIKFKITYQYRALFTYCSFFLQNAGMDDTTGFMTDLPLLKSMYFIYDKLT